MKLCVFFIEKHCGLLGSQRTGTDGDEGRERSQLDSVRCQQNREKEEEIVKELGLSLVDDGNA
jgi:hypothetical protein